jgi:hypothetical protein
LPGWGLELDEAEEDMVADRARGLVGVAQDRQGGITHENCLHLVVVGAGVEVALDCAQDVAAVSGYEEVDAVP